MLSSEAFLADHEQSILAMITSSRGNLWPSDIPIQDWREADLNVPSRVRLKLFTLDNELIVRRLGTLSARDADAVAVALTQSLVVARPTLS